MNSIIHKESPMTIAFKQIKDKLYHNTNSFVYLIILHLIGYFFSFSTGMGFGSSGNSFEFIYRNFTPTTLYVLTILWMIMQGFTLAEEKSRQYYMVSNNFTAYFSDIAVLEIYALIGGTLTLFSGFLLQVFGTIFMENFVLHSLYGSMGTLNYLTLFLTGTLYFLIFGTAAYLVGILRVRYQTRFALGALAAAVVIILLSILSASILQRPIFIDVASLFRFYLEETRFFIWLIKVLLTIAALYGLSYVSIKNMEVNRS